MWRSALLVGRGARSAGSQHVQGWMAGCRWGAAYTAGAELKVGDQLPQFELPTDTGTTISTKDMVSKHGAVIFAFPKAGTSGCTVQAKAFRDQHTTFEGKGYQIYGISADPASAQTKWKTEHRLGYPLLSDESYKVLQQLGFSPDGKSVKRSHMVVEKGGRIRQLSVDVSPKDSAPQALHAVAGVPEP